MPGISEVEGKSWRVSRKEVGSMSGWACVQSNLQPVIRRGSGPSNEARMIPTLELRLQSPSATRHNCTEQMLEQGAGHSAVQY